MSTTLRLVGRIVEKASPESFVFVTDKEEHPQKFEYVIVKSREYVNGVLREVDVLAQVVGVLSSSTAFNSSLNLTTLERVHRAGIDDSNILCTAKTLGFLAEENGRRVVLMPRRALFPGNPVFLAPDVLVSNFFSYEPEEGLYIGTLVSRSSVPVYLSVNGFRRHVAVIAQTGAGKSYTVGVIIEELLRLGGTVVIIDPHADYVFLSRDRDMKRHEYSDRILVFRNPNSTGRYSSSQLDNVNELVFKFSELEGDEVAGVAGIPEGWSNVREVIRAAIKKLREKGNDYQVRDLIQVLEEMAARSGTKRVKEAAQRAINHLRRLTKFKVFGERTTSLKDEILKPGHVSVIDLSGLNDASQDYIVSRILEGIFELRYTGQFRYPIFVVVEEAHRFVPGKESKKNTMSSQVIKTIAAEGRKFGVFLVLVTQRPSKIDSDALSQCNSQIILRITNPLDQRAVQESSERLSADLLADLPGLNVGEAVILGELTRVPVVVKVRARRTKEGGADIDLVEELRQAREELRLTTPKIAPPAKGVFSEV
ncbi:ATP-binding protein [Infirmifilum uzonense]|uniref:ATP-binding protein n=1 Tax=Infirmifilum uzonense TaxID=1550241 RepID=UPI00069A5018|nr:ATP-binding protein [Infirmifilum uzonense]